MRWFIQLGGYAASAVPDYEQTAQRMTKGAAAATSTDDAATPKTHTPPLGALLDDLQRLGEENGRLRERLRIMEEQASTTDDEKKPRTGSSKTGRLSAGITIRS